MNMSRTMQTLILVFGLIHISYGLFEDCKLEGVNVGIFGTFENVPIDDTHDGIVAEFKKGGITDVDMYESKYLKASIEGDKILVKTTESYSDIEYELNSSDEPTIRSSLKLTCENGTTNLGFYQPIKDNNNNEPFFNKKVYQYRFGMEVNKGFELTELLSIYATDVDLTHGKLDVTIEKNDFLEIKANNNKWDSMRKTTYYALTAKNRLKKMDETFKITVSDSVHSTDSLIHLVVE